MYCFRHDYHNIITLTSWLSSTENGQFEQLGQFAGQLGEESGLSRQQSGTKAVCNRDRDRDIHDMTSPQ